MLRSFGPQWIYSGLVPVNLEPNEMMNEGQILEVANATDDVETTIAEMQSEMTAAVAVEKRSIKNALRQYDEDLLRVALRLVVNSDEIFFQRLGMKLAASVVKKGGPVRGANQVFDHFEEYMAFELATYKKEEHAERQRLVMLLADVYTTCAEILPPGSQTANRLRKRALYFLAETAKYSIENYQILIVTLGVSCFVPADCPGAVGLIEQSTDELNDLVRHCVLLQKEAGEQEKSVALLWRLAYLDATMVTNLLDIPVLGQKAVAAFTEHCEMLKEIKPESASTLLKNLFHNCSKELSPASVASPQGIPTILALIEKQLSSLSQS